MTPYRYELATLTADELAATAALLQIVFPHAKHLTPAYLQWHYADNPDGRAVAVNAWAGDALVGHMAAVPMRAALESEHTRGLFLQNGAIHPDHRGRKLQSHISACIFDEAAAQGHRFCLGAGNKWSTGPLLTRFKMLRPFDVWLGVGAAPPHEPSAPPSLKRLWSEQAIAWRLANPEARYSVRGGRVLAPTGKPGIAAVLHEWLPLPDQGPTPPGPLRLILGLRPASARRASYLSIPRRLRPSPLNLVWRDLAGGTDLPDPDRLDLQAIDFDYY